MILMVIGASRGLGRAFVEGLPQSEDTVIGVSRSVPSDLVSQGGKAVQWIAADLSNPSEAVTTLDRAAPAIIDTLIYNLGIWEPKAFSSDYDFLTEDDETCLQLIEVNVAATLLILKRLLPRLLRSARPRIILTGSTSGLSGNGRPEVAFGASKAAINGIAAALREGYRAQRLGVTVLQLGYLNTEDSLAVPVCSAALRRDGALVPVHDVVSIVKSVLSLSDASFVKEIVLPAIGDDRF